MVGNALGISSRDVGTLCSSDKIKVYARNKPQRGGGERANGSIIIPKYAPYYINYLGAFQAAVWHYPPASQASQFNLGDFREYNTNPMPPVWRLNVEKPIKDSYSVRVGDSIRFSYDISGINPYSVNFTIPALRDKYLGCILTATKSSGTTEEGWKYGWDYKSAQSYAFVSDKKFYDSSSEAHHSYLDIEIPQVGWLTPGTEISCLLALFDSKDIRNSYATSMMLMPEEPEDMFLCDNTHYFKIVS